MIERVLIVAAVLALTALFAYLWQRRDGRFSQADDDTAFRPGDLGLNGHRPEAVLVEFGGEHCAPCRTVERRLHNLATEVPGLEVVTIDAGERLDLADRYGVRRIPTVFVADRDLRILHRASGTVTEHAIRAALPASASAHQG